MGLARDCPNCGAWGTLKNYVDHWACWNCGATYDEAGTPIGEESNDKDKTRKKVIQCQDIGPNPTHG